MLKRKRADNKVFLTIIAIMGLFTMPLTAFASEYQSISKITAPLTGDDSKPWIWVLLIIVAVAVCIYIGIMSLARKAKEKKKKNKKAED